MELFFIIISALYFVLHLILLTGLVKSLNSTGSNSILPKVSVIVAARNEKDNIASCIRSLARLDYPDMLLEIILVNDNSTDNTYDIMISETRDKNNFKVINSRYSSEGNLKGKANAIDTAIEICSGDLIVTTDADCTVNPQWVKSIAGYYNEYTGMVCGFTSIRQDGKLFSVLQNIDWMYLLTLASASSGLKLILSCLGNNLSFAKKAYNSAGGYKSITFSVTEDLALMRKIDSLTEYEIKFPPDANCLVETLPCSNVKELFSQKRRWFRGGTGINFLGYLTGFELYFMNVLLLIGPFLLNYKLYLALLFLKSLSELIILSLTLKRFGMIKLLAYYPLFALYFALYGLLLPLSFFFGKKINWKGQKF